MHSLGYDTPLRLACLIAFLYAVFVARWVWLTVVDLTLLPSHLRTTCFEFSLSTCMTFSVKNLKCVSSAKFLLCPVSSKVYCFDLYVWRASHFDGICQGFGLSHGQSGGWKRVNIPLIVTHDWYLWCWYRSTAFGFRYTTIPKICNKFHVPLARNVKINFYSRRLNILCA